MKSLKGHPPEQALQDYAEGTLTADVAGPIGAHVRGCEKCSEFVSMLSDSTSPSKSLDPAELAQLRQAAEDKTRISQPPAAEDQTRISQPPAAPPRQSVPPREGAPQKKPSIPPRDAAARPSGSRPSAPPEKRQSVPPTDAARAAQSAPTVRQPSVPPRTLSQPPREPASSGQLGDDLPPTGKRPSVPQVEEDIGFARTNFGKSSSGEFDASKTSDELLGTVVGEYKLLERLGQGGMGTVYKAEHALIGKSAAVKVLLEAYAGDNSLAQRMLSEARAVNSIRHPNIVDVFAFGQLPDGRPYFVMELLAGKSLADILVQNHSLSLERALHVLSEALAALEAAHAVGVVHRDLKPDNIFINPAAKPWKVKLLDFGLAKTEGATDAKLTRPGAVMGTPGYMAPEQVRSADAVSPKTDVYAMGVVAWAVLAGKEPFRGNSAVEIMHQHLTVPAPPLSKAADDIPPALDALVTRMLAKHPDQRPTAAEARAEIEAIRNGTAAAPVVPAVKPKAGASPALVAGVGLAVVAVVVGALAYSELSKPAVEIPREQPLALDGPLKPSPKVAKESPKEDGTDGKTDVATDGGAQVAVAAAAPKTRIKSWPCSDMHKQTHVMQAASADRQFLFEVKFKSYENVLIVSRNTKKDRAALEAFGELVAACKREGKKLGARVWQEGHSGYPTTDAHMPRGTHVWVDDALIVEQDGSTPASMTESKPQPPRKWACSSLFSISEPIWTFGRGYRLVLLKFKEQQNLVIVADNSPQGVKDLDRMRKAIVRCEGTSKLVVATKYNENHEGFVAENLTHPQGIKVNLAEMSIQDP